MTVEALAQRTLTAINDFEAVMIHEQNVDWAAWCEADRIRVASDLAGLREHHSEPGHARCPGCFFEDFWPCPDARRYADGLLRTAALYGVVGATNLMEQNT